MSRREFLRFQAGAAGALAAMNLPFQGPCALGASSAPDLAVVTGDAATATRTAIKMLGGMSAFVRRGDRVVIKPNMSFARGVLSATNTSPEVVSELVGLCREAGASRIRVLDHPLHDDDSCIRISGMPAVCTATTWCTHSTTRAFTGR
jgi:hypothetical protein